LAAFVLVKILVSVALASDRKYARGSNARLLRLLVKKNGLAST